MYGDNKTKLGPGVVVNEVDELFNFLFSVVINVVKYDLTQTACNVTCTCWKRLRQIQIRRVGSCASLFFLKSKMLTEAAFGAEVSVTRDEQALFNQTKTQLFVTRIYLQKIENIGNDFSHLTLTSIVLHTYTNHKHR